MIVSGSLRRHLFRVVAAAVLAVSLLVSLRPSAEAAIYRNHIARIPETPTSAETVTIWIESDTALGETAGVETLINGVYTNYYGTFDDSAGPDPSNWKVELPAQPNGTTVQYQLFTRNQSNQNYGHTGFNWTYTVDDGDIQWSGLYHDTFDQFYRSPFGAVAAGTDVTLRFRTVPLDVDGVDVRVYTYDPSSASTTGPVDYPMTYLQDQGGYAIWTITLDTPNSPAILYYHFKVTDGLDVDYYSDDHGGPHDNLNQGGTGAAGDEQGAEGFQLTVYDPAFQTPDWLQDAVVYQIFPDRFRNGDPSNDYCRSGGTTGCPLFYGDQDVLLREPWNTLIGDPRTPGPYFNEYGTQFYGGDLQGLIDKLDYLKAAGFDTIYTTPIFDGSSNHRYDTDDYLAIDPALGTLADFNEMIDELEARDMYLIVDGVFNHTSSDSVYFDRYGRYPGNDGACESLSAQTRDWFEFLNNDIPCGTGDYTGWFGYDSLAVLVDGEAEVRDFIYRDSDSVMETWYDRGVHGWRFDVADEISHNWWRDFRPFAKADAPNGPLVGEVWPDASAFLLGDQLDSVMNYRFRKNVLGFVRQAGFVDNDNNGNNEIIALSPSQFDRAMTSIREDYPPEATAAMLNLLDSHDTNRLPYLMEILGETEQQAKERQKLAAVFQYTYMGAPMVYYGDEVALDSPSLANHVSNGPEDDPYNRAPYPWADEAGDDDIYGPADADMLAFYSRLAEIRRDYPALIDGVFQTQLTGDTTWWTPADDTTYAFVRYNGNNYHDRAYVVLNPGSSANTAELYVNFGVAEDLLSGTIYPTNSGNVTLNLPPRSAAILVRAAASVAVEKVVDGNSTGLNDWQFSVNGNNGYTLPPAGGEFTVSGIITGTTTVAETDLPGWAAAVSCDNSSSGTDAVTFNLDTGEDVRCTFTNTLCQPGTYDDGAACTPTDPGYYTDLPGAIAPIACVPGYYQPAAAAVLCIQADPGYYAPGPAAVEQTACPSGTTSPAGSDSIDDCVAVVTTATLTIAKETDPPGGTGFPFTLDPGTVTFVAKWGSNGVGQGQFNGPFGIAVDGDGNVYVADAFAYRVQKFDADGNFLRMWGKDVISGGATGYEVCLAVNTCKAGTTGSGNGEFNLPHGIAVDGAGNVYVGDTFNNRIQKFDANGAYLGQWGGSGNSNGQFNYPNGLAVDDAGNVYVGDTFNHRIQKFDAAGGYLGQWGGLGSANGKFNNPYGVAVYGSRVYVADTVNDRLQVFDADGNYLDKWGSTGAGNSQFEHPYGIAVDAAGNVYVADSFINTSPNNRIQKFDAGGGYLGQWGSAGSGDGQFDMPTGVAVARGGDVYVAEYEGHRVQRFSQTGTTLDDGQNHAFAALAPGTYLVSELVPDNWNLDAIACNGGSPVDNGTGVSVTLAAGDDVTCTFSNSYTAPDTTAPTVTINQASGQSDPTGSSPINFTVVFSEPVSGFATGDVTLSGTAGATTATVTGGPTTYNVAVSGMTGSGTVIASIAANVAEDGAGNDNAASTSTDNSVTYNAPDTTAPTVTIDQDSGQDDPTSTSPIHFIVVFSELVSGFATGDVTLSGTAGATTAIVTPFTPYSYTVAVSGMTQSGTVIASIAANVAEDGAGNDNTASTSTDNEVTYNVADTTAPTVTINQASGQADPTGSSPINFTVVFSEPVTGFITGDVTLSGTAGATAATVSGGPTTYNVAVSGMTGSGTVIASVPANVAEDGAGNDNVASTSTDNEVTYNAPDTTAPTVTINQASGQADPTSSSPINFTVVFSEPVTGFATGDVTLSGTAGATTATVSGGPTTYNVAVSGMTGNGTVIASIAANVAEDGAGNDNAASTSTDNQVTYNAPAPGGAIYVTAAGGKITGGPTYQKNDILKWNGNAWSVWFDGASAGMLATADIIAFDVDDDSDGSAWITIRQAQKLPGVGKMEPQQIAYYNGSTWSRFFDGRDVGLLSTGERINGLEVLPGSVSPIGSGCQYYLLISTIAGGGVPVGATNVNFTGEDVLGFCMTQSGTNTAGTWHIRFEGQSEGLQKNNNLGLSASDDAATLYFTVKSNFTGDGGLVRPSQLFSFSGGVFSGPLWKAADHGLTQQVDGIDVVGALP